MQRKNFYQVGEDKQFYRAGNTCLKSELSKVQIKHRNHLHTDAPPPPPFIDFLFECIYDRSCNFDDIVELVFPVFKKTQFFASTGISSAYFSEIDEPCDNAVPEICGTSFHNFASTIFSINIIWPNRKDPLSENSFGERSVNF